MLDFCGRHNITADVEIIPIQKVNEAYERLLKADVKYRFSIDVFSQIQVNGTCSLHPYISRKCYLVSDRRRLSKEQTQEQSSRSHSYIKSWILTYIQDCRVRFNMLILFIPLSIYLNYCYRSNI